MKRRNFIPSLIGALFGVNYSKNTSTKSLGASVDVNTNNIPEIPANWLEPRINVSLSNFIINSKAMDKEKYVNITFKSGVGDGLGVADSVSGKFLEKSTGQTDITDKINVINITDSNTIDMNSIDLGSLDTLNFNFQIEIESDGHTYNTDVINIPINVTDPIYDSADYQYTDNNNLEPIDVSNINSSIEVTLEGARGSNGSANSSFSAGSGGKGALVVAEIDLSEYNELQIHIGKSGSNGGGGIHSGG